MTGWLWIKNVIVKISLWKFKLWRGGGRGSIWLLWIIYILNYDLQTLNRLTWILRVWLIFHQKMKWSPVNIKFRDLKFISRKRLIYIYHICSNMIYTVKLILNSCNIEIIWSNFSNFLFPSPPWGTGRFN